MAQNKRSDVSPTATKVEASTEASEDHYIDPISGLLVFTAKFHIKRGHCCHSDCRHCPYPKSEKANPANQP